MWTVIKHTNEIYAKIEPEYVLMRQKMKPIEKIKSITQTWIKTYQHRFGQPISKEPLWNLPVRKVVDIIFRCIVNKKLTEHDIEYSE